MTPPTPHPPAPLPPCKASKGEPWLAALLVTMILGCRTAPPPPPVPAARQQAQLIAQSALALSQQANWTAAEREWARAADRFAALNDRVQEAVALHNLAQAQRQLGRLLSARDQFERAARINQSTGQTNAWWRNQLALVQLEPDLDPPVSPAPRLDALSALLPALTDPRLRGLFLNDLGRQQLRQGEIPAAETTLRHALETFRAAAWPAGVAAATANLADTQLAQNQFEPAYASWTTALRLFEQAADLQGIALAMEGLGRTRLAEARNLPQAEDWLRRAARGYHHIHRTLDRIRVLESLFLCLQQQQHPIVFVQQELAEAHESAAAFWEAAESHPRALRHWQAAASLSSDISDAAALDRAQAGIQRCSNP